MIEDIILRATTQSPFTTKGSALSWSELDDNFIEIGNAIIAIDNPGAIPAYNAGTGYEGTQYVSYDSKLWKHIGAGTTTGVTPGTDPTKWARVSIGVLAHQQNKDSQLEGMVGGLLRTVTIEQLYYLLAGGNVKSFAVDISSAELLALNTTPKTLATPASGTAIELIACRTEILFVASPPSISYATNTTLQIAINGADRVLAQVSNLLTATKAQAVVMGLANGQVDQTQLLTDAVLQAKVSAGDPTAGDFNIKISGLYREVTLEI